jgi:hypothetical protein
MSGKMYLHIKHNESGPTFKVPVSAADFLKDAQPVNADVFTNAEPDDHDDWYNIQHAFEDQNHIPETYK